MTSTKLSLPLAFRQFAVMTAAAIAATVATAVPSQASGASPPSKLHVAAFNQALQAQRIDDFEHAQQLWEALLNVEPRLPEALNNLAALAHARGQEALALRLLEQAATLPPHYASIEHNLAMLRGAAVGNDVRAPTHQAMPLQLIDMLPSPGIPVARYGGTAIIADLTLPLRAVPTDAFATSAPKIFSSLEKPQSSASASVSNQIIGVQPASVEVPIVNSPAQVQAALRKWLDSWTRRDQGAYLAFYGPSFIPAEDLSRSQWEQKRHMRLQAARDINIQISNLQVSVDPHTGIAITRFAQYYRSGTYQDRVIKTVQWQQYEGRWRISAENTLPLFHFSRPTSNR